ncbi:hypothetical protein, partial [Geoalkalibacter sp.]|uniref:hypothetical protein n=1 Tax=Geoalkalibacter sp. TaxID=3041440 RepID=UPI00272E2E12
GPNNFRGFRCHEFLLSGNPGTFKANEKPTSFALTNNVLTGKNRPNPTEDSIPQPRRAGNPPTPHS